MSPMSQRLVTKYALFLFIFLMQLWFIKSQTTLPVSHVSSSLRVEAATCQAIPAGTGSDTLTVQISAAGTYTIWSRMKIVNDTANSVWLKIDSDCPIVVGDAVGMPANSFTWVNFRDGTTTSRITTPLTVGSHILTLYGREAGAGVDSILFTTDTTCTPARTGSVCTGPTATATPSSGPTSLALTVALHGIGTGGDNANPNSTGNNEPMHPQRSVTMTVYDSQNQQAAEVNGTVAYNQQTGKFTGVIQMPANITSGVYTMRLQTDGYLRKVVPGIITITKGQTAQIPVVTLITGDATNDNLLSILDYNVVLDCYSDLLPARNCSDPQKLRLSDFTDDGKVSEFDYNLFLRELSTQGGQ